MRYVIVGGSAAAISAVETIRSIDKRSQIDLFSDEETPLFSRVLLPYYVAEELSKQLLNFRSLDFFDDNNITAHIGEKVSAISTASKTVTTEKGETFPFDKCLLATGGRAISIGPRDQYTKEPHRECCCVQTARVHKPTEHS